MSLLKLSPLQALTRTRRPPITSVNLSNRTQQRCASTKNKRFLEQIHEPSRERARREKEQIARYAALRDSSKGGKTLAIAVTVISASLLSYWLGSKLPPKIPDASTITIKDAVPPYHKAGRANMQASWVDFRLIVGEEYVSTMEQDLEQHAGSEWSTHVREKGKETPFLVVYPKSTEEVSAIMKICHKRKIPVTAYSGGTSLEGHYAATRGGICIDFKRMDKILKLNTEDMDVVVQPAVGWEGLNEELSKSNLFFPPDPGPGALIGGMVGTGCSGTNAYRYGTMREWVLSLTVVLADGTIVKTRQRPRKSSAGYDLTRIFIGSEGTLGLVTEATLKLTTKPNTTSVAVCTFASIREAASCVSKVVNAGVPIAAIEILDDMQMKVINHSGTTTKRWSEAPTLFFKFAGTPVAVQEQVGIVQDLAKATGSKSFEFAKNELEQKELWSARKMALWSVMALMKEGDHVWTGDVAVPISRLPDIIEETQEDLRRSGMFATIVGHVGDGNFHTIMLYKDRQRKKAEELVHRMVKRAVEMEGTVTGEHGVGLVKRDYLVHELGASTVDLMRMLKKAFDPLCLLNCDKVVRVEKPKKGEVSAW